ncbi:hypothetical protein K2E95_07135 [Pseudomonas sp. ERGC3:01]|nr:hypothetical protein [Pseudomonas sp. ERGC3:01]
MGTLFNVDERSGSLPVYNKNQVKPCYRSSWHSTHQDGKSAPTCWAQKTSSHYVRVMYCCSIRLPRTGATNTGKGWRCSIEARFQPLAEPLALSNFAKPLLTQDWQTFYEGWRTWGFYWRDRHPPLIPFDPSWEHWRDLTAIGEAVKGNKNAMAALEIAARFGMSEPVKSCAQGLLESFERIYDQ